MAEDDVLVFSKIRNSAFTPTKASKFSAGWDIYSPLDVHIQQNGTHKLGTGLTINAMPKDCYCRIAERSSVSIRKLVVGGGVIDSDYRGEIFVILHNISNDHAFIPAGTAVAQVIVEKVYLMQHVVCLDSLVNNPAEGKQQTSEEVRGDKGFGELSGDPNITHGTVHPPQKETLDK